MSKKQKNYPIWDGPMVWDGRQLENTADWLVHLSDAEITEIENAIADVQSSDKPIAHLTQADFNLKTLKSRLSKLRDDVLHGSGFAVLRGLPADQWSNEDLIRAYWGIGNWFGSPVSQNAKGHLLGHVIDQRTDVQADTRIYQTNQAQPFHSDSCDIVGLLCLQPAKSGGASAIASSAAIHNALLQQAPDALEQLYGKFYCDRYNEIPKNKDPHYAVQIFNEIENQLVCCGMDPDIRSAQRLPAVGVLPEVQRQALDAFQEQARQLALNMTLQRGDIQLVNNHTVVHAREQFDDHAEPERRRYMIRLWLSSKQGRTLPEFLKERWGNIEPGTLRGGIRVAGTTPTVQLEPDQ